MYMYNIRSECDILFLNRNRHGVAAKDIASTEAMRSTLSLPNCTSSFSPNLLISPNAIVSPSIVPVSSVQYFSNPVHDNDDNEQYKCCHQLFLLECVLGRMTAL